MSETQAMSVTRGLRELKLLDQRITSSIQALPVADVKQEKFKEKALLSNLNITQFENNAKAKLQSVEDLMKRKNDIKTAIVLSNAKTRVKVGTKEMTVAEAIEQKSSIDQKKALLSKLRAEFNRVHNQVEAQRAKVERDIEKLVEMNIGKDRKTDSEDFQKIAEPMLKANLYELIDPLKVKDRIETLEKEIEDFESNIDIALSEVNSKTEIQLSA